MYSLSFLRIRELMQQPTTVAEFAAHFEIPLEDAERAVSRLYKYVFIDRISPDEYRWTSQLTVDELQGRHLIMDKDLED